MQVNKPHIIMNWDKYLLINIINITIFLFSRISCFYSKWTMYNIDSNILFYLLI